MHVNSRQRLDHQSLGEKSTKLTPFDLAPRHVIGDHYLSAAAVLRYDDHAVTHLRVLIQRRTNLTELDTMTVILHLLVTSIQVFRSEERRVGKECRSRWA